MYLQRALLMSIIDFEIHPKIKMDWQINWGIHRCKYNKILILEYRLMGMTFSVKFFQFFWNIFEIFHDKMLKKVTSFVMIFREGKLRKKWAIKSITDNNFSLRAIAIKMPSLSFIWYIFFNSPSLSSPSAMVSSSDFGKKNSTLCMRYIKIYSIHEIFWKVVGSSLFSLVFSSLLFSLT